MPFQFSFARRPSIAAPAATLVTPPYDEEESVGTTTLSSFPSASTDLSLTSQEPEYALIGFGNAISCCSRIAPAVNLTNGVVAINFLIASSSSISAASSAMTSVAAAVDAPSDVEFIGTTASWLLSGSAQILKYLEGFSVLNEAQTHLINGLPKTEIEKCFYKKDNKDVNEEPVIMTLTEGSSYNSTNITKFMQDNGKVIIKFIGIDDVIELYDFRVYSRRVAAPVVAAASVTAAVEMIAIGKYLAQQAGVISFEEARALSVAQTVTNAPIISFVGKLVQNCGGYKKHFINQLDITITKLYQEKGMLEDTPQDILTALATFVSPEDMLENRKRIDIFRKRANDIGNARLTLAPPSKKLQDAVVDSTSKRSASHTPKLW